MEIRIRDETKKRFVGFVSGIVIAAKKNEKHSGFWKARPHNEDSDCLDIKDVKLTKLWDKFGVKGLIKLHQEPVGVAAGSSTHKLHQEPVGVAAGSSGEIAGKLKRKKDHLQSDEEDESEGNDTDTDTDRYRQRQRSHATPVNPTPTVQAEQTEKEKTYCAICCAFSCAHLKGKEPADNKGEGGAITVETPPGEEGESLSSNTSRTTADKAALGWIRGLVDKLFNSTGTGQ